MKKVLIAVRKLIKVIFPKSRWGNVIYLLLGFIITAWAELSELVRLISALIK